MVEVKGMLWVTKIPQSQSNKNGPEHSEKTNCGPVGCHILEMQLDTLQKATSLDQSMNTGVKARHIWVLCPCSFLEIQGTFDFEVQWVKGLLLLRDQAAPHHINIPCTQAPSGLHLQQGAAFLPLGTSSVAYRKQLLGSVLLHSSNLPWAWQDLGWHSPVALEGNQRLGVGGSACGQKGHPPRDWCTCLGPTPTLCVWPGGLPGPLCTRDGWPSERTAGSTAGDYGSGGEKKSPGISHWSVKSHKA